jgi:hypothetical protein
MGCSGPRAAMKEEEQGIVSAERKLNLTHTDITNFDLHIRKHSAHHLIGIQQFQTLSKLLKFRVGAYTSLEPNSASVEDRHLYDYWKQFHASVDTFDQYQLLVLGVFQCRGKPENRAAILFDAGDK